MVAICYLDLAWVLGSGALRQARQSRSQVAMRGGKTAKVGLFSPVVEGAKMLMGEEELNKLRGEVIKAHTQVISTFVETSESKFGKIALQKLFEAADKDSSGQLDKEEIRSCLIDLGFNWMDNDKKIEGLVSKGDLNGDEEIDFEEFVKQAPKTLRQNLVKLAKQNGNDLGFLV
eukprot:CAMPEP_0197646638 /NCGR_PEP_ID=MMETSP1338-20131121/23769_1 /TAXON_ID=43686 ORGANISM="Pelagodinium beii, Strain RCC1491" /NCGR_SAMPLE_ID=MMETSP1338 /ASSEMBLY_ACC=CAM_ASM_000754 /LENGTH=173 /DNA_ID=CAMNT_0043220293 /DNA_START=108 /DNA_END=629 /DNA_ORIENTATION=+